jgi:8-oxo-dGTP pyrophosphatase MutT (NUDIX family)
MSTGKWRSPSVIAKANASASFEGSHWKKLNASASYRSSAHTIKNKKNFDSVGMVLCTIDGHNTKYALVKRRSTYGLWSILRVHFYDTACFSETCNVEREDLLKICNLEYGYEAIYRKLWDMAIFGHDATCESTIKQSLQKFINNRNYIKERLMDTPSIFPNGVWGFPKGKYEGKESDIACALREVKEETCISIADVSLLPLDVQMENYKLWTYKYYIGTVNAEKAHNIIMEKSKISETSEVVWLPFEEALKLIPDVMIDKKSILKNVHHQILA